MTLQEAIETGKQIAVYMELFEQTADTEAIKLLIEAGRGILDARSSDIYNLDILLPGETKE